MTKSTISITLEGALNALAKSKDGNHVAVAGRTVFKILQINDEEAKFVELMNMRVGKNLNLNSSCNDVVWSHLDPNILATGATNGAVVIWRMDKSSRSKMDYVYTDHKRTVNKVCFHPNEPNYLISGSQDGRMNLFDLRQKDKAASTFLSQSESVRDVQFSRFRDNVFSSVQENGNVQIWNLRKTDHYETQFTAHSGPVFSCDWHLEDQRYLATAGRDKTIKIWEISSNKPQLEHCITSVASVARIKWRPHQYTHIASSSLVVDFNIYIWDYKRPFVPFANLQEHRDVSTDFIWRDTNANILISVGKDGTVYQHTVGEVDNWLKANPCALNLNNSGDIFLATSNYLIKEISPSNIINYLNTGKDPVLNGVKESSGLFNSDKSNSKNLNFSLSTNLDHYNYQQTSKDTNNTQQNVSSSLTSTPSSAVTLVRRGMQIFQHNQSISSQSNNQQSQQQQQHNSQQTNQQLNAQQANLMKNIFTSSAAYFKNKNVCKSISMDWFCKTALNYQLTGKPMNDLFEHNATVAENLDRPQIAQTWRILKQLYIGTSWNQSSALKQQTLSNSSITNNSPLINSTLLSTSSSADTSGINKPQQQLSSIGIATNQLIGNNSLINDSNNKISMISYDKATNELKTRNNSGQQNRQSRQTNGNTASMAGMQMINISQQQQYQQNSSSIVPSSSVTESSTLASRSNQFGTTRNRLATYSGSSRLPLTNTTPILPLNLTQSNKSLTSPAVASTNKNDSDNDESDDEDLNEQRYQPIQFTPIDKEFNREHQAADFFFGDGDVNETHGLNSYDGLANNDMLTELDDIALNLTEVQREAFQLKHEIPDFTVPPDLDLINNDLNAINLVDETETIEDDYTTNQTNSKKLIKDQNVDRLLSVEAETNSPFKFSDIVVEMLRFYANQGDVQTTVSVCIILGKQISHAIDLATQEHWFHSYIDLLSRFQLWNIINQVSNLSVLPSINSLNQISTTIYTSCANCNKPINQNKVGWFCKCKNFSKCSVCHEVVKGIYVWCKTCSHGGHINHLQKWFEKNKPCPVCHHLCEYF